ncbi:hypothetical protein DER46DRAFT_209047 [Fusarium sp. MPI-SDFR-AT-0072]|nr:hypothetical protein DER46DRAFT_209047 [Fusarium sp. MPI-SDFR-AT-0072]
MAFLLDTTGFAFFFMGVRGWASLTVIDFGCIIACHCTFNVSLSLISNTSLTLEVPFSNYLLLVWLRSLRGMYISLSSGVFNRERALSRRQCCSFMYIDTF